MRELRAVRKFIFDTLRVYPALAARLTLPDGTVKIYPYNAPERRGYPYVVVSYETGRNSYFANSAAPVYTRPIYLVKAVSDQSLDEASELNAYVQDALTAAAGTVSEMGVNFDIEGPLRLNPIEFVEVGEGGKQYRHSGARWEFFLQPVP